MFSEDKLYQTDDPALLALGRPQTLAHWRSQGRGPTYVKVGGRVVYRGADLNAWLALHTIRPAAA